MILKIHDISFKVKLLVSILLAVRYSHSKGSDEVGGNKDTKQVKKQPKVILIMLGDLKDYTGFVE